VGTCTKCEWTLDSFLKFHSILIPGDFGDTCVQCESFGPPGASGPEGPKGDRGE